MVYPVCQCEEEAVLTALSVCFFFASRVRKFEEARAVENSKTGFRGGNSSALRKRKLLAKSRTGELDEGGGGGALNGWDRAEGKVFFWKLVSQCEDRS